MFKQQDIYKAAKRKGVAQGHEDVHEERVDDNTPEQSPNAKPVQDLTNLHPNKRIL